MHIDTAQYYGTEAETQGAIDKAGFKRSDVWVTSKSVFTLFVHAVSGKKLIPQNSLGRYVMSVKLPQRTVLSCRLLHGRRIDPGQRQGLSRQAHLTARPSPHPLAVRP